MPEIGEIRRERELGYKGHPSRKYIWSACVDCGKERWVRLRSDEPTRPRCRQCAGRKAGKEYETPCGVNSPHKISEKVLDKSGYVKVLLSRDDPFHSMAVGKGNYVLEHRLVVARALGRCLKPGEIVHHKGDRYPKGSIENKQDNRYPENLELLPTGEHDQITMLENRVAWLEKRVTLLEAENVALKMEEREEIW